MIKEIIGKEEWDKQIDSNKQKIVFFSSKQCIHCNDLQKTLDEIEQKNEIEIFKINVKLPENENMVKQHNIRVLPTLHFMKDKKIFSKTYGAVPIENIEKILKNLKLD